MTKRNKILTWAGCIALIVGTGIGGIAFSTTVIKAKKPAPGKDKVDQIVVKYDGTSPDGQHESTGNSWTAMAGKDGESWGNFHAQVYPESFPQDVKFEVIGADDSSEAPNFLHFEVDQDGMFRVHWSEDAPAGDYSFRAKCVWGYDESQYQIVETPFYLHLNPSTVPTSLKIEAKNMPSYDPVKGFSITSDQVNDNFFKFTSSVAPSTASAAGTKYTCTCDIGDSGVQINPTTGVVSFSKLTPGEHHVSFSASLYVNDSTTLHSNIEKLTFSVSKPAVQSIVIGYAGSTGEHIATTDWIATAGVASSCYGVFSIKSITPSEAAPTLNWEISNPQLSWLHFDSATNKITWGTDALVGRYTFKVYAETKGDNKVRSNELEFTADWKRPAPENVTIDDSHCSWTGVEDQPGSSLGLLYATVAPATADQSVTWEVFVEPLSQDLGMIRYSAADGLVHWDGLTAGEHTFKINCYSSVDSSIMAEEQITLNITAKDVAKSITVNYTGSNSLSIDRKTQTGTFPSGFSASVYPATATGTTPINWSYSPATSGADYSDWLEIDSNGFLKWKKIPPIGDYSIYVTATDANDNSIIDTYNNVIKITSLNYQIDGAEIAYNQHEWSNDQRHYDVFFNESYLLKNPTFEFDDSHLTDFKYFAYITVQNNTYGFSNIDGQGYENYDPLPDCFKLEVENINGKYSLRFSCTKTGDKAFESLKDDSRYSALYNYISTPSKTTESFHINISVDDKGDDPADTINWILKVNSKNKYDFVYDIDMVSC